jgi:hypothetical protein
VRPIDALLTVRLWLTYWTHYVRFPTRASHSRDDAARVLATAVPIHRDRQSHFGRVRVPSSLPPTFDEMASISASDDVQNPDKIRSLLKDLREARQAKSRDGLEKLNHNELSVGHPNPPPLDAAC